MAEHSTEATAELKSEIRPHMVRLLTNWGKNANAGMVSLFVDMAIEDGLTAEQVERGVRACIRGWKEPNGPQGWGAISPFMPKSGRPVAKDDLPWFGNGLDGSWGGDWTEVPIRRWISVAGMFAASLTMKRPDEKPLLTDSQRERAEEFLALARRRVANVDIEHAAKAAREGRLSRFVSDWMDLRRAKLRGETREQEALAV